MNSKNKKHLVCSLDDLKKADAFGTEIVIDGTTTACFLIYHENLVYSYLNRCPHTGINLDWTPNQFLNNENEFIQCSTHGALFNIKDGLCLRGPCVGDRLQLIENEVFENNIYLIS